MPFLSPILLVLMCFLSFGFSMVNVFGRTCDSCDFNCTDQHEITSDERMKLFNWGHSVNFSAKFIEYPSSIEEVRKVVCCSHKIRVAGSKHSYNAIDNTLDTLLGTRKLNKILAINPKVPSVTVQAGITYAELNPALYIAGFALPMLGSETALSVGGATQTGVHGSGLGNQNVATQIRSLQLVLANGTVATFGQNDEELKAVAVGLGSFGVITQIELNLVPTFNVTTHVFIEIYQRSNSNTNASNLQTLFGAIRSQDPSIVQKSEQPWHSGLTAKSEANNTNAREIDCEYFVPYKYAVPAIKAVLALRDRIYPSAQKILLRTIAGDDLWLSEVYSNEQSKFLTINFYFFTSNESAVAEKLALIESTLLAYEARPHWGKFFTMAPKDYLQYHSKLDAFRQLTDQLDPHHKFRNEFVEEKVFLSDQTDQNMEPLIQNS